MAASPRFRRKDASVEAGFRRIAIEEIDAAIAVIDARGEREADRIHKVRRQMKALRALLQLVRPAFKRFDQENRDFRDMARTLSGSRDAQVMLDTFDAITRRTDARRLSRGMQMARERLAEACTAHADVGPVLVDVRARLVAARGRAKSWALTVQGWDALSGGMARTYRQARRAMRAALASGDAEASHEWRKGVKYHGLQARLLRAMGPESFGKDIKTLSRLGDILGARHDLDLFLDSLAAAPSRLGDIVTVTQLAGVARLRLARLDRQAARLGERLFADRPHKLAARWGGWWKDWRGTTG